MGLGLPQGECLTSFGVLPREWREGGVVVLREAQVAGGRTGVPGRSPARRRRSSPVEHPQLVVDALAPAGRHAHARTLLLLCRQVPQDSVDGGHLQGHRPTRT